MLAHPLLIYPCGLKERRERRGRSQVEVNLLVVSRDIGTANCTDLTMHSTVLYIYYLYATCGTILCVVSLVKRLKPDPTMLKNRLLEEDDE